MSANPIDRAGPDVDRSRLEPDELAILDTAVVAAPLAHTAEEWPIAAAMLQFPSVQPGGKTTRDAGPDAWRTALREMADSGFRAVEIPSAWLPLSELSAAELDSLAAVLSDLGMDPVATSVVRKNIIDAAQGRDNLALTHRAIDAAAAIGSPHVSLGMHEQLTRQQREALWFWTVDGAANPLDRDSRALAIRRYRDLANHAAEVGIDLSIESYEGTYLGTADDAVAFILDIGRDNVGLNPDLGNLIRAQRPIERWESMAVKMLPLANYWHVKNYSRAENPATGTFLTIPSSLANGLINYRKAIRYALSQGFHGAFLCENYGGDGLAVAADHQRYIRDILRTTRQAQ
ncbi:MAG: sugar phosphate isomerase/epimerase [Bifidobacteriaceae bacterium]|jgi:sugar phosphate isomerase/epimerase|nr:sugar phosphate isomerase/epimerase [Bifidobacteriaceae bacterium]